MDESSQSAEHKSLQALVTDAWSRSDGPPNIDALLAKCDSGDGQLAVLLFDLHLRHQSGIATKLKAYLKSASLVDSIPKLRSQLLEFEFEHLRSNASSDELNEFLSDHPEVCTTQIQETDVQANDDTIVGDFGHQPPPSTINLPACQSSASLPGFGRYKTERLLGKGSFGSVYLANDSKLGRKVAIKSLHANRFESEQQRRSFMEELQSTARLNHPSIVTLYDVAETSDGSSFAVMEYVDGKSLADQMKASSIDLPEGIEILVQVAQALSYAHQRGFFHRDLKPANILVGEDGRPRVADFGLAIHEDQQQLRVGERAGTPAYMAPEQVRGESHRLDGRTDLWCFGVIMYEMLTARLPFRGENVNELFDDILHRKPRPPRQVDPDILPELDRICSRCLTKNVDHRYGNADDLAIDLDKCLPLLKSSQAVSIASNPALIMAGLGLIVFGGILSVIGGFFLWVTYLGLQWAFTGLGTTQEFLAGIGIFSVLSSPFFLGMPVIILGLWLLVVQGFRWRGRTRHTSGKAVAALAFASMTPLFNLLTFLPTLFFAKQAFQETRRNPRVKGRVLALTAAFLATAAMVVSTWFFVRTAYVYSAYRSIDRAREALESKDFDDAAFESRMSIEKFPAMAAGWLIRGQALLELNRTSKARETLTESLSLYLAMVPEGGLQTTKNNLGIHNAVFGIAKSYQLRSVANRAMGEDIMSEEDQRLADWYLSHTIGRPLALGETVPPQGFDIPALSK